MSPRFATGRTKPGSVVSFCTEKVLSTIDGVIQRCRPPEPLRRQLTEQPLDHSGTSCAHHPDAPCVLCRCREQHPGWTEFPEQSIRVVLYRILSDRCTAAVLRRIRGENAATIAAAMRRIAAMSPDESDEDACWVLCELVRRNPDDRSYAYGAGQIASAWWTVRRGRRRLDTVGAGGPRRGARRLRSRALSQLTAELQRPLAHLLCLDIDDYNPYDATLAVRRKGRPTLTKLSGLAVEMVDDWLEIRGSQHGYLFEIPILPEFWETTMPSETCRPESAAYAREAGIGNLAEEDCLDRLSERGSPLANAFLLHNATDRGGDWSPDLIARLRQRSGLFAGHRFSRYERHKCRKMLEEQMERAASDDASASVG